MPHVHKVMPVTSVIHMCPKTFAPDPEAFRPERFIDEKDGKFRARGKSIKE